MKVHFQLLESVRMETLLGRKMNSRQYKRNIRKIKPYFRERDRMRHLEVASKLYHFDINKKFDVTPSESTRIQLGTDTSKGK